MKIRLFFAIVLFLSFSFAASAVTTWRGAYGTNDVAGFTRISTTSGTSVLFTNVDGGAAATMTAALTNIAGGVTSFADRTGFKGTNSASLYRQFLQNNAAGGGLKVTFSGLEPGAQYKVGFWYYDDAFQPGSVQSFNDITTGTSIPLGSLTNTPTSNASAGNANLPQSLYDSRYFLSSVRTASASGTIAISFSSPGINTKINGWEIGFFAPATTNPVLKYVSADITDSDSDLKAEPGEPLTVYVKLLNSGTAAQGVQAAIFPVGISAQYFSSVTNSTFDTIGVNESRSNSSPFVLLTATNTPPGGYVFSVTNIAVTNGFSQSISGAFTVQVYQAVSAAPTNIITFAADLNGVVTNSLLIISNSATIPLYASFTGDVSWIEISPPSIVIAPHSASNVNIIAGPVAVQAQLFGSVSATYSLPATNFISFPVQFDVGPKVEPLFAGQFIVETGGINQLSGVYEPGEQLQITVTSTNNGAIALTNIAHTLTANGYFNITAISNSANYGAMAVGDSTSTTYQVVISSNTPEGSYTFYATNSIPGSSWGNSFSLFVLSHAVPSVSPSSISISVLPGAAATNTEITVTNSGNAPVTFSITDDGDWGTVYTAVAGRKGISDFIAAYDVIPLNDPNTSSSSIEASTHGVSDTRSIGFSFPFYGANFSNFYVTADGYIGLLNTTNAPSQSIDRAGNLPAAGGMALIAPFWGSLSSTNGSICCIRSSDYLVISYVGVKQTQSGGGTNLAFQAALYRNGNIEFRYNNISGSQLAAVSAGMQNGAGNYTNLTTIPSNGVSVLLTPQQNQWVHYTPAGNVIVCPRSSQVIKFIADASGKSAGVSNSFTAQFNWSTTNIPGTVTVSAQVTEGLPVYSAASSLSFTGAAGRVTSVPFIMTNAGTDTLNFTISNSTSAAAVYLSTNPAFGWIDISLIGTSISLNDPSPNPYITAEDEGFSAMIPFGFVFPFYGSSYAQFCVSVNGALRLDTTGRIAGLFNLTSANSAVPVQMIAPFWSDLMLDANAALKYHADSERVVITWENVRQRGFGGGSNLTFQAVLKPNGDIVFQYKQLEGLQWPNAGIGLRDTTARINQAAIVQTNDWAVMSYPISGLVYTQYVYSVGSRAVQFRTEQIPVIGYTPNSGSIPAGSNAVITITGDASGQTAGAGLIETNAALTVTHNGSGSPASVWVTFTVTNSQQSAFVRAASDGLTDEQKTFGTPVFTPAVSWSAEGTQLSWTAPEDGIQRTYRVYFTRDLMIPFDQWSELATVTNGTGFFDPDPVRLNEPVIYYRVGVVLP